MNSAGNAFLSTLFSSLQFQFPHYIQHELFYKVNITNRRYWRFQPLCKIIFHGSVRDPIRSFPSNCESPCPHPYSRSTRYPQKLTIGVTKTGYLAELRYISILIEKNQDIVLVVFFCTISCSIRSYGLILTVNRSISINCNLEMLTRCFLRVFQRPCSGHYEGFIQLTVINRKKLYLLENWSAASVHCGRRRTGWGW